tara:strand:- start:64 stop:306 length:243 start_codon:yes stop_codon:yes gene_type:complete
MKKLSHLHQNLLVDNSVDAVKKRLETTLGNIRFQQNIVFWDDIEKIEHCIKALENIQIDDEIGNKEFDDLVRISNYNQEY